jgi:L-histidine Nalpha-methyltransferase
MRDRSMQSEKDDIKSTHQEFASHVRKGLCQSFGQKWIDPKFFYDEKGSYLFDQICLQREYYITRTETEILERHSKDIVSDLKSASASMIEFGNGSSVKTRIILKHFFYQGVDVMYFPIDISQTALISSIRNLSLEFRILDIIGISSEYLVGIKKISSLIDASSNIPRKKVMFFLGSSIGNFEPDTTISFLKSIRHSMRTETGDNLFISFDLEKDFHILESAYNDKAGITSKFNLNLLKRINNDLGGTFNLRNFSHYATYNKKKKRIEMYIISKRDQEIYIRELGQTVSLKENERIHTENSYKYSIEEIKQLAEKSGFIVQKNYTDTKEWFDLVSLSKS